MEVLSTIERKTPNKYPIGVGLRPFVKPECLHARPGDLIEIDRTIFAEWGLYFGKGEVVLLGGDLMIGRTTSTKVVKRKLTDMGNVLVRVNNKKVPAKNRSLISLKAKTIIQNVNKLIGKTVEYNILSKNSEHYVTEWKYGHGWSDQSRTALQSMTIFSTPPSPKDAGIAHEQLSESIKSILQTQNSIEDLQSSGAGT
ncbi:phospholipase A and acyltransferase 3-like [Mytilus trossulus]|uniref:phospholipase A and acyltransferase 3-like n=1 Tax=Mytilus trossulus TaxID=6551 RepID=UPI003005FAA2